MGFLTAPAEAARGGFFTTPRAFFALFVGVFTIWKVRTKQIYEKVRTGPLLTLNGTFLIHSKEKREWLSFVEWRTRTKIHAGQWDPVVLREIADAQAVSQPKHEEVLLRSPQSLQQLHRDIQQAFASKPPE